MVLILSSLPNLPILCEVLLLRYRLAYTLFGHMLPLLILPSTLLALLEDVLLSIISTSFFKGWVYFHFLTSICLKVASWILTVWFFLS